MIRIVFWGDPMRLLIYYDNESTLRLGIRVAGGVLDVAAAQAAAGGDTPTTPDAFFAAGLAALPVLRELTIQAAGRFPLQDEITITFGAAVPKPGKILCVGLNYRRHAAESDMALPKHPVLFSKFNNALAAHSEPIPIHTQFTQIDYEAELAVVIGKTAKHISETVALDYVLGYTNANDLSDRHLQFLTGQWLIGKTPDKFLPLGPYIVTADEAGDPQTMPVRGWLNGELRQDSTTADMIFSVAEIIAFASQIMTLEPGDVITTGTPEGVILGRDPKVWMQVGDEYTIEIGNLGRLSNRLVEEQA